MESFEFQWKNLVTSDKMFPRYLSLYKNGDVQVVITEPAHECNTEEDEEYWNGLPCKIYIGDGKPASLGGWSAHTEVHKKNDKSSYVLLKPLVGPMSFFETPLHRAIEDIDENEENKYGAFKRAFLWAEQWLSEHYPEYTILPDEMRKQGKPS